jgi:hypothetical protein
VAAEPLTVVSIRLADLDERARVPGSVDGRCSDCGELVSIGPQTLDEMKKFYSTRVLCTVCVFAVLAKEDPDKEVELRRTADAPDEVPYFRQGKMSAGRLAKEIDEAGLST